jgi:hypothetical protein
MAMVFSVDALAATFSKRIATGADDVEQNVSGGRMMSGSSDLEMVMDGSDKQLVGLRFTNVSVPKGAVIQNAYIQFVSDEVSSAGTSLSIRAQRAGNAAQFSSANYNLSSRSPTSASISWSPAAWTSRDLAGSAQRTPSIASVVQEVVNLSDYASGNAMVIIIQGSGKRVAQAYDRVAANAALLVIDYTTGASGAVNGLCGSANGVAVSSPPQSNLCSFGTASAVTGSGPFNWSCAGSNGGTTAQCSAPFSETPPPPTTNTFGCLGQTSDIVKVTGHHEERYEPAAVKNRAFDARTADFLVKYVDGGMIRIEGSSSQTGMCFAGGYVRTDKPWDASWTDHKDLDGPTRQSTPFGNMAYSLTLTGMHFFNVHDGPRSNAGFNATVQHSWGEYIRDDAVENDHMQTMRIYDTLFDGSFMGPSTRPGSGDSTSSGAGQVVTLDKVLLRLLPMPYPPGDGMNVNGIPYGQGKFFKIFDESNKTGKRDSRGNHFALKDVVLASGFKVLGTDKMNMPPPALVDRCENVTILYLSDDGYTPHSSVTNLSKKFPNCIKYLQGQAARDYWKAKVIDWHKRHPDVGADRKPSNPGEIVFPVKF